MAHKLIYVNILNILYTYRYIDSNYIINILNVDQINKKKILITFPQLIINIMLYFYIPYGNFY